MFRTQCYMRAMSPRLWSPTGTRFVSSSVGSSVQPNAPLELDPSLRALLQDVDISLVHHQSHPRPPPRHLEALSTDKAVAEEVAAHETSFEEDATGSDRKQRKSPAAHFGSQQIGAVVLPFELQKSINSMIANSEKPQLHNDAKRLFRDSDAEIASESHWTPEFNVKYRSRSQASRHAERDGTAFASIALPAHYSAIFSVLDHVKRRLGPEWNVHRIIDWGAGTGSGLWAALYSFQKPPDSQKEVTVDDLKISESNILVYLGIDKRDGLVSIGKRLFRSKDIVGGRLSVTWQKSFHEDDKMKRSEAHDALAISAFTLSSLPTPLARKALVKEMWESGANVMILIDHNTDSGFESIAEAREYLLNVGRKEFADPVTADWDVRGSHVVAPCPHDGACPLRHHGSSKLVCGFSQRLQRPPFVRLTKHSGMGHEDVGYSYVVVRRGSRPANGDIKVGRVGDVGKWAMDKDSLSRVLPKELMLHTEHDESHAGYSNTAPPSVSIESKEADSEPKTAAELEAALRMEAFSWPRLVFPPLKRSGHIILDSCTAEGKIMRLTIPKSQGKQPYYDARKSSWGDIFPHEPKNAPQERYQPIHHTRREGIKPIKGENIGKRHGSGIPDERTSYEALSKDLKETRKMKRRERLQVLDSRLQ